MSRYKPFGKSKAQHGGFQFDKLLKVCSNSKKVAAATNTIGSMGRFGITSFTSTRNTNLDSSGEDDSRLKSKAKRPRLDSSRPPILSPDDPYGYSSLQPHIPSALTQENVAAVFKPRKFFKSRDPVQIGHEPVVAQPPPLTPFVPPITIPIPTLTLSLHNASKKSNAGRKKKEQAKTKGKHSHASEATLRNSTNVSPTARVTTTAPNDCSTNNMISPSIKLRIFKDKTTSTFVSVSDASPQKDVDVPAIKVPGRRGRKKKSETEKPAKQTKKSRNEVAKPLAPPPPIGRTTRNSRKHQNSNPPSDSNDIMPVLSREDAGMRLTTLVESEGQFLDSPTLSVELSNANESFNQNEKESSFERVKKLEEEDPEFRQLSAMLSSMEDGEDEQGGFAAEPESHSPSPTQQNFAHFNAVRESRKSFEDPRNNLRDIRSILEDDWDENCEDDSPKKTSQSPSKVTRFDMSAAFGEDLTTSPERRISASKSPAQFQNEVQRPFQPIPEIPPPATHQPFNAPHAVRNLLSGFADTAPVASEDAVDSEVANLTKQHVIDCSSTNQSSSSISAKKGSIFKSRAAIPESFSGSSNNPKKRLALYKHKFGQESGEIVQKIIPLPASTYADFGDDDDEAEDLSLRRLRADDGNSGSRSGSPNEMSKLVCQRKSKRLFTVVRNVKAIHELQESGEVHEFDGDVWYILEDLKDKNPVTSRCLSAITLAMRCMEPAFRMHLRAHGTVAEFCKELHDAPSNPALALLAATVLFVLSQDRLNMDLDTESLQLIIALSKIEENTHVFDENPELAKHRQRVIDLVSEMQSRGHAEHLKIEKITAAELALETLLYLTSKRAGEWVKHELRTLGGLDYITTEVDKSLNYLKNDLNASLGWTERVHDRLWKIDRCLRVLQQVSFNHEENQRYLLGVPQLSDSQNSSAVHSPSCSPSVFVNLFRFFGEHLSEIPRDAPTSPILREVLFSVLRVLVNLTHDYRGIVLGSEILANEADFIPLILQSVFQLSAVFSEDKVFDLLMHSLCMLLNLVEHSLRNRNAILAMNLSTPVLCQSTEEKPALDALIQMFFEKERDAKEEEGYTDDILTKNADKKDTKDSQGTSNSQKNSQDKDSEGSSLQDIIDKLVQTAGRHMENSLIAAYISLLLAYLVMDNPESALYVRNAMPNGKYLPLMVFLKKLFNFMSITSSASGSIRGLKATSTALKFYAKLDPGSNEELKKIIPD